MKKNILLFKKHILFGAFCLLAMCFADDAVACHNMAVNVDNAAAIIDNTDPCNPIVEICYEMTDLGSNFGTCQREFQLDMTGSIGTVTLTPMNLSISSATNASASISGNEVITVTTADNASVIACVQYQVCPGATLTFSELENGGLESTGSVSLTVPAVNLDPTFTLSSALVCKNDVVTITPNATDCGEEWTLDGGAPTATAPTVPTTAAGTFTVCRTVGINQLAGVCDMQSCQTVTVEDTQAGPASTIDECFGATTAPLAAACTDCDVPAVAAFSGQTIAGGTGWTNSGIDAATIAASGVTFANISGTAADQEVTFTGVSLPACGSSYTVSITANMDGLSGTGPESGEPYVLTLYAGTTAVFTENLSFDPLSTFSTPITVTTAGTISPAIAATITSITIGNSTNDTAQSDASTMESIEFICAAIPATTAPANVAWYPDNGSGMANTAATPLATTDTYDPIATADLDPNVPGVYNYFATCECNGCESDPVQHTVTILPEISIVFEQGKCDGNPDGDGTPVGDTDEYDYEVFVNFSGAFDGGMLDINVGGIVIPTITTTATDVQYNISSAVAGVLTTAADGMDITATLTAGTLVCSATPFTLDLPECSCVYELCDSGTTTADVAPASTADVQPIGYELFYILVNFQGFITQVDNNGTPSVDFDVPDSASGLCSIRSISYNTADTDAAAAVANIVMNATTLDEICGLDGCIDLEVSNSACYLIKLNEAAAPTGLTITNSTCDPVGDLTGGSLNGTAAACEVGSVLNFYSDAAGTALIGTTAPTFDQENAQTFYTRCIDTASGCVSPLTTVGPSVPGECVCDISGMTLTQDIVCDGTGSYTVQVSWVGGPDASVSFVPNNGGIMSGDNPATDADGTATFTFDINGAAANGYSIDVMDTQGVCNFGPFAGTTAPTAFDSIVVEEGTCEDPPVIVLPAGYTCTYTYLSSLGTDFSTCNETNPQTGTVEATYCTSQSGGNNTGTVTFTVTDDCGRTQALAPVDYACYVCDASNGEINSNN